MSRRAWIALLGFVALAAALRIALFTGLQIGDDIVYSRVIVDRLHGKVDVSNVQETRTGFLFPLLVSYALFGAGEGQLVLYNLLCSIALIPAVFFLARRMFGPDAGVLAAALAAIHPTLIRYATECHTDTPLSLWLTLALLVFVQALDGDPGSRRRVLAGLLLGWGLLHKESTVYMGLFFVGHAVATRRSWRWYLPIALPAAGVLILDMVGFAVLTGNPLARYAMIRHWHAGQYMAERYTTAASILRRDFLELPLLMFTPWYGRNFTGLVNLAGLLSGIFLLWKKIPGGGLVAGWFLAFFAAYCFWPSSISPYLPGFFLFEWTIPVFGPPLACAFGGAGSRARPLLAGVAIAGLAVLGVLTVRSARLEDRKLSAGAREAREWIAREKVARIITDDKTVEGLDFLEGHRPSRLYIPFQEADDVRGAAVIVDKFWSVQGQWWSRPVRAEALRPPASWRKVHESDRIVIYRP